MSRAALLLLLALGALVVAGAAVWTIKRPSAPAVGAIAHARVGDVALVYDTGYARFPAGRAGGRLDRLDLAATLPDFHPAGGEIRALDGDDGGPGLLFLSIAPAERSVDPADRTATLYANFLEPEVVEDQSGLIMRRFAQGSPYSGEDLYFDAPEGRRFAARCTRPAVPPDALPVTCVASLRLDGLDVDMRFSRAALRVWPHVSEGVRALLRAMRAN